MSLALAPTPKAPAAPQAAQASQAAPAVPYSLLRMAVGNQALAVPIGQVREILEVGRLTVLPHTPDFVRGVMNLRGAVVPVVDLAARLSLGITTIRRRSCIVVVDSRSDNESLVVGLLVDAVHEVFDTDDTQVEPVPMLGTPVRAELLAGMTRARGQVVAMLDLGQVLSTSALADAIAAWQPH